MQIVPHKLEAERPQKVFYLRLIHITASPLTTFKN